MRFLLQIKVPNEPFNTYVKDGSAAARMQKILQETKPEAAYFTESDGKRTGFLIAQIEKASGIPSVAEPWFLQFNAEIHFHPVMLGEDLAAANLEQLGSQWK